MTGLEADFQLRIRGKVRVFPIPSVMGIINATPDSFFDGDPLSSEAALWEKVELAVKEGADFLDLGGESSRPGAEPVGWEEECSRVIPILKKIKKKYPDLAVSIDTCRAETARLCLEEGADLVNDISAGEESRDAMFEVCGTYDVPLILMHKKGRPADMQKNPEYRDVVNEVGEYLENRAALALQAGLQRDQIILDPGIGFGKMMTHNLDLLKNLSTLAKTGFPILVGASMKRIVGDLTGRETKERLSGSLGLHLASILNGASLLRVHDVGAMRDTLKTFFAVRPKGVR